MKMKNPICFYTGVKLDGNNYSLEHLISKKFKKSRHIHLKHLNEVHALRKVNNLVGNSPLRVKFALKDYLCDLTICPEMTKEQQVKMFVKKSKKFLEQYKLHNSLVWFWYRHMFKASVSLDEAEKLREEIKNAYLSLLSNEEKDLGLYIK